MIKQTAGLLVFLMCITMTLSAQIVVRQDKDGTLNISNVEPIADRSLKDFLRKSRRTTTVRNRSSVIPAIYKEKIRSLCEKYGVQESLVIAVAKAESGFNPMAVSHKGAVGIMQLMSQTASLYGVSNRYDAEQNMEAGVRHLKYLYDKYSGDIPLTLAAYNAGEEAVKKYNGVPPYSETRIYVKRVMQYMGLSYVYADTYVARTSTRIYQYRTTDGKIMITDSYPTNAVPNSISIIE